MKNSLIVLVFAVSSTTGVLAGSNSSQAATDETKQCADIDASIETPDEVTPAGLSIFRGTKYGDVIVGTPGDDVIYGYQGNDLICGLGGNDTVFAGAGNDRVFAGKGSDHVQGGLGLDALNGGRGADVIRGGAGNDTLVGGLDNDVLSGGPGQDSLAGGSGVDEADGGPLADSCEAETEHSCNDLPAYDGTKESIWAIIHHVFPAHQYDNIEKLLACENITLDPRATNRNTNRTTDYGIFQINSWSQRQAIVAAVPTMSARSQQIYNEHGVVEALFDPGFNTEFAFYITQTETWRKGGFAAGSWRNTRWGAWTCGKKTSPFWHF